MSKDTEPTAVIFRKWKNRRAGGNGVIALFPLEQGSPGMCMSFEHFGQHGSADYDMVMHRTRPATSAEYTALRRELEAAPYGYRLAVYKRHPGLVSSRAVLSRAENC